MNYEGKPINKVKLEPPHFVVENCVICGETHRHGCPDHTEPERYLGERSAHCGNIDDPAYGSYIIELEDS
jgi:hypothetical protein